MAWVVLLPRIVRSGQGRARNAREDSDVRVLEPPYVPRFIMNL